MADGGEGVDPRIDTTSGAPTYKSPLHRRSVIKTAGLSTLLASVPVQVSAQDGSDQGIVGTVETKDGELVSDALIEMRATGTESYQAGTLSDVSGTLTPGEPLSVTIDVEPQNQAATDNVVFGSLGSSSGDVYAVEEMGSTGSGTVTVETTIPEDADGDQVIWSWHPTTSGQNARDRFTQRAITGSLDARGSDWNLIIGKVGSGESPTISETTRVERYYGNEGVLNDTTDENGEYAIGTPEPATYTAFAGKSGLSHDEQTVTIGEDETREVNFVLDGSQSEVTFSPNTPIVDELITFDAAGLYDNPNQVQWDFGDGTTESGEVVSHTYAAAGAYDVTVTIETDEGSEQRTLTVEVGKEDDKGDAGITAEFDYAPTIATPDITVSFDATVSGGQINQFEWDFGDGTTANGSAPSHTYSLPGRYEVELRAVGTTDTGEPLVDVTRAAVGIDAGEGSTENGIVFTKLTPAPGETITFTTGLDESQTDSLPRWDFDDGTTAEGFEVTHEFTTAGTYTITLESIAGTFSRDISVESQPIEISNISREIGGTLLPNLPLSEQMSAAVNSGDAAEVADVDFGFAGQNKTVTTAENGLYSALLSIESVTAPNETLQVQATAAGGATDVETRNIDVLDLPPWLDFLLNSDLGLNVTDEPGEIEIVYDPLSNLAVAFEIPSDIISGSDDDEGDDSKQETNFDVGFGASFDPVERTADVTANGLVTVDLLRVEVTFEASATGTVTTDLELVSAQGTVDAEAEIDVTSVSPVPLNIPIPKTDRTIGIEPEVVPGLNADFNFNGQLEFQDGTVTPRTALEIEEGLVIENPVSDYGEVGLEVSALGELLAEFDVGTENRNLGGEIVLEGEVELDILTDPSISGELLSAEFGEGVQSSQTTKPETNRQTQSTTAASNSSVDPATLQPGDSAAQSVRQVTDRSSEDTQPTVAPLGSDSYVIAWSFQDANKSSEAGHDIIAQRFESESSSEPERITDNSTSEVAPVATALGDGRVLLAWKTHTFDATNQSFNLDEYIDSAEITFSIYDGSSWSSPQQLTDTDRAQQRPTVAAANDEWLLAWQSIDGSQPTSDIRAARIRVDGEVTVLQPRPDAANPDLSARSDSSVDLVYCTVEGTATTGVQYERLEGSNIAETEFYSANGVRDVVVADGRLVWISGRNETEQVLVSARKGNQTELALRDEALNVSEISLASTDSGDLLSYRANWRGSSNRDLIYRLNRGNGWIRDRRVAGGVEEDLNLWYSESRFLDDDTFVTTYAAGAPGLDAANDIFLTTHEFAPAYGIDGSIGKAGIGDETTIEYTVTNRGDVSGSAPVTVEVRGQDGIVSSQTYDPLSVNESIDDSVSVTVDETGTFELSVGADEPTLGDEPTNIELVAATPALRVDAVEATRENETTATVRISIANSGGVPIQDVPVSIEDSGTELALLSATEVPAGGTATVSTSVDPTALNRETPQSVTIGPNGTVPEGAIENQTRLTHLVRPNLQLDVVRFRRDDYRFIEAVIGNYGPGEGAGTMYVRDTATGEDVATTAISVPPGESDVGSFQTLQLATPGLSEGDTVIVGIETPLGSQETDALAVKTEATAFLPGELRNPYAAYTNSDGVVGTDGLRNAVDDWRTGDIATDLLREVIDAWRSGEQVE